MPVRFLTRRQCYELVLNGTILDAKSIIAIQRLYMAPNHMIGVSPYDGLRHETDTHVSA